MNLVKPESYRSHINISKPENVNASKRIETNKIIILNTPQGN